MLTQREVSSNLTYPWGFVRSDLVRSQLMCSQLLCSLLVHSQLMCSQLVSSLLVCVHSQLCSLLIVFTAGVLASDVLATAVLTVTCVHSRLRSQLIVFTAACVHSWCVGGWAIEKVWDANSILSVVTSCHEVLPCSGDEYCDTVFDQSVLL